MSIERPYRYRACVHHHPTSIYDGDTFRLDIDYGFRQWHMNVKCRLADVNYLLDTLLLAKNPDVLFGCFASS